MTCIVGIVKGGTVWIGGDSAGTDSSLNRILTRDPKAFVVGDYAFGVSGSPKVMDAVRYGAHIPDWEMGVEDRSHLVNNVVPHLRETMLKLDCAGPTQEGGIGFKGALLVGFNGRLYQLQSNFQLVQSSENFASVGSGSALALGALHSSRHETSPRKRINQALEVAAAGNAGVAPPFVVVSVKSRNS